MRPTLHPGDGVVAIRSRRAAPGQLRVVEHPWHPGKWLVKRVVSVDGAGGMRVGSDNAEVTRADSRTFGTVPVSGSLRVILRVPWRRPNTAR